MDSEFRANERTTEITWRCICGARISEHDPVAYLRDGEAVSPGDVTEADGTDPDYFCSRDCAHEARCDDAAAAQHEEEYR